MVVRLGSRCYVTLRGSQVRAGWLPYPLCQTQPHRPIKECTPRSAIRMAQITNPSFYIKIKYLFIILIILFCLILAKLEWILKEMCKKKTPMKKKEWLVTCIRAL